MADLGRIAGISSIGATLFTTTPQRQNAWRLSFVLGMVSGSLLIMLINAQMGASLGNVAGTALMLAAGLFVWLGATLAFVLGGAVLTAFIGYRLAADIK